jgi:hypothetical protein
MADGLSVDGRRMEWGMGNGEWGEMDSPPEGERYFLATTQTLILPTTSRVSFTSSV